MKWQCRMAPSLGALEDTPDNIWGTKPYLDQFQDTVFFGLYGLPDFFALWRHKGRKCILWAGSDIQHFINGYWLDEEGRIRIEPEQLAQWINENCESYVENGVEHEALMTMGIESKIVPSFLGKMSDYEVCYSFDIYGRPDVYASVSGDNFAMYGWEQIEMIADKCNVNFHLYGSDNWVSKHSNVFVHGRVPKEQMNEEIKGMQCGLRLNEFDGFSEIVAKSLLWGHQAISRIAYGPVIHVATNEQLIDALNEIKWRTKPNLQGIEWMKKNINKYPWASK